MSFWRHRNVFVTGCTGFLGAWLTAELVERGARVVGLVRDMTGLENRNWLKVAPHVTVVRGELEDELLLERVLAEYEVDTVIHLAAQPIVQVANRSPLSTFRTNIAGTWNVLEACRRSTLVQRVVIASSDKAYGNLAREEAVAESLSLAGLHPYDVSKSCADLIAQAYHHTYRLPVAITRCGNFYGGGDLNWNRIVPGTVRSVLEGDAPVIRSDGKYVRDYLYVRDAVSCYLTLAENVHRPEVMGQAFNFSAESPRSVLDLTQVILRLCGRQDLSPQVLNLAEARNEIPYQALDSSRARQVLGWQPQWSLEDGLQESIAWYRDFLQHEKTRREGVLS
ncbi:MAG: GDP-mannose 4,6-dehydratase [Candidatus Xenobia bacterium]